MFVSGRAAHGQVRSKLALIVVLALSALALSNQELHANAYQWPFSSLSSSSPSTGSTTTSTTTTTTTTTTNVVRLKANKLRRPDSCRDDLPRKSEELPALVVTGRVREVYLTGDQPSSSPSALSNIDQLPGVASTASNKALVTIGRVIRGNQQLVGSDIIVSGFNSTSSTPCPNYVKPNDTLILLLEHDTDRRYTIQGGNLLPMNLANLDRVNAVAADEPHKRRGPIDDILCEAKYCPYGRCVVVNEAAGEVACRCPDSCPSVQAPVCGSDNATYTNECHLIKEGCNRQRPLFVTKETSC